MATIYKHADGKRWRVIVRRKGQKSASKYFSSHVEAVKWARAQEVDADRGELTPTGLKTTVGHLVRTYRSGFKKAFTRTKAWNLNLLEKTFDTVRLDELNGPSIINFVTKREKQGAGPVTNGQTLTYLRSVIRHGGVLAGAGKESALALAELSIVWDTLAHSQRATATSNKRDRRPTEDELVALLDFFDSRPRSAVPMSEICLFAIATAMRQGEIVGPKGVVWEDFSEATRTLMVRKRKDPRTPGGRDMQIPLLVGAVVVKGRVIDPVEIILRQRTARLRTGRIFPNSTNTVSVSFTNACRELGIEDLVFHDLRHDGISRMFEADYTIAKVASVSGHKSWKNLQRYTHINPEKFALETQRLP